MDLLFVFVVTQFELFSLLSVPSQSDTQSFVKNRPRNKKKLPVIFHCTTVCHLPFILYVQHGSAIESVFEMSTIKVA